MSHRRDADPATEATFLARIRAGDASAVEALYSRYYETLHLYAHQHTGDPDAADEIIHDVFLSLWRRRETLAITTTVAIYLFAAVRHRCVTYRQTRMRDADATARAAREGAGSASPRVDDDIARDDLIGRLWRAVETLPPNRREALTLRWREQMSFEEIATVMGTTVAAVKMQVSRALATLREELGETFR
jgi:RNA polymerase sigma-70 factor (family 1)